MDQLAGQYRQQSELQQRIQEVNQSIMASHQQFQGSHPDHAQAMGHVRDRLSAIYQTQGLAAADAVMQANRSLQEAAVTALANGRDPASALYEQAQALGFAPPQQEPQEPAPSLEEAAAKLKMVQEGQKAAVSPSQGGAQPAASAPQSLEDLADMGDKALDDETWRRFMTGRSRLDQMMP